MNRKIIKIDQVGATAKIFGSFDSNARLIEDHFSVTLRNRESEAGDSIVIEGEREENVSGAAQCIAYLHELSGKTFLAVAMAVRALREKKINRIILTRPAIEAGEKLGFLPGDLQSKIDPYLRPLYDALYEMLGVETYQKMVEKGVIEIAPLAYMRGRTLDDSFIILDEAQNATPEQMKMFLTRLGFNSKAVVTGDITQTDLPRGQKSGLASAVKILSGIDDIGIHYFSERDVVRHRLVQKIIQAYEKYDREQERKDAERRAAAAVKLRDARKFEKNEK